MNSKDDVKDRELELWHAYVEDDQAAGLPEYQHGALRKHAGVLERWALSICPSCAN